MALLINRSVGILHSEGFPGLVSWRRRQTVLVMGRRCCAGAADRSPLDARAPRAEGRHYEAMPWAE